MQDASAGMSFGGAERRHLSVVFCDLVGSTALSTQLDPEELADLIGQYQRVCTDAIQSFEGFVARYLGDGVLAYFGYPRAHEDDSERAVHAALEVIEAVGKLVSRGKPLQVRVGIASGQVVVGQIGRQSHDVTGETANLAARLQSVARHNQVIISEATHLLVGNSFECAALDPVELAGFPRAVNTWRVIGRREHLDRFDLRRAAGLTPYVNHVPELEALEQAWRRTEAHQGQVVVLSGEAGIGKSRLLQEFNERIASATAVRIRWHGSPYLQNSPLWPVIQYFQSAAGFKPDDDAPVKREKLDALLASGPALPAMSAAAIAATLSLPPADTDPPLDPDPQQRKRATFAAKADWITQHCARAPVVLACEDLHWFDPTTRELLDQLIAQATSLPLMLILTQRPESEPPRGDDPHVTRINLGRLRQDESLAIAEHLVAHQQMPAELLHRIVARGDGIPLFIEELTKTASEAGFAERTTSATIPVTLQDSLVARLDRLPGAKEVAQVGAAIGREFSLTLLHAVLGQPSQEEVRGRLEQLVRADLLHMRAEQADRIFVFRHALLQDAAYETLLWSRRREIHERIADALERLFPDIRDNQPEVLAQHWDRAGRARIAISHWERAADRAIERSASTEASAHLRRALHLIEGLPEDAARDALELPIVLKHGAVMRAIQGPHGEGAGQSFERARELSRRTGDRQALIQALAGLFGYHLVGARNEATGEIARELLAMAEASGDRFSLMLGHRAVGMLALHTGEPIKARVHLERAMSLYDAEADGPLAFVYGTDHGQTISSFLAVTLWVLGLPDAAIAQEGWGVAQGRRLNHRYSQAQTDMFRIIRCAFARDWDAVAEIARQTYDVGIRNSFGLPTWMAQFHLAFCRTVHGDRDAEVLDTMQAVLQTRRGTNYYPLYLLMTAEALATCGNLAAAIEMIVKAREVAESTDERLLAPELLRFHATLLRDSDMTQAETLLRAALADARQQGARGWELRAAVSLADLLAATGRKAEARDTVAAVRAAFNQGATTPDLRMADELLASLDQ
ncbi:adenylate/guanylate cyclase domain-containing protein [Bradyrhizobium erythrophlei]|uniref:adenylate/guanylate cyclase domain-containing protein n=1 Tax=Bradyrhizobium erythrophlei TaxID=1437360 RepID=UPI0035E70FBE